MIRRLISSLHPRFVTLLPSFHGVQPISTLTCFTNSNEILSRKIENALKQNQLSEAWEAFTDFRTLHGFPTNPIIIAKLVSQSSYSSDSLLLRKGHELVVLIHKNNPSLLHYDFLAKLAVSLARSQLPTQASTVLRIMLDLRKFPPMDIWKTAFLHMVKAEIGTYLASDILSEICDCYVHHVEEHGAKNVKHLRLIKPDTMIFNLVLDGCVRFRSSLKGEQMVELMASLGIVADATTIVLIAQIYEMNGLRDEVKKLKQYVDRVCPRLCRHYRQFYDSFLSLILKFDDIDSAVQLVLDMYKHHKSYLCSGGLITPNDKKDPQKPFLHTIGSRNLRTGLRLPIEPELLQRDFVLSAGSHPELVTLIDGRLVPSNKALAKIIHGFHRHGRIGELSKLLVCIQKESDISGNTCLISDVLGACIQLRWLQTAHDILDDMGSNEFPMGFDAYLSLLRGYCKENMLKEAVVLIRQMRRRGWLQDLLDEDVLSESLLGKDSFVFLNEGSATLVENSRLAISLIREMREDEKSMYLPVYEINSSIYFFCKANMMDDAWKTYQRMQERNIQPIVQTFAHLINGYSKLRMFREITILWGEIRRKMDCGHLSANRDLHEMLLSNFIRGGYFERVLEIIEYMKRNGLYADKWKYKREFLKFHKYLYRSLKEEKAKTEAQRKRLEHVRAFRKCVSID